MNCKLGMMFLSGLLYFRFYRYSRYVAVFRDWKGGVLGMSPKSEIKSFINAIIDQ